MNACEFQNQPRTHTFSRVDADLNGHVDRAVVRVIKRAMVMVLQTRQSVTGVALLADLAYLHLCEGGASGPIRHEGGADSPEFYRLCCIALDELQRDGFVASRRKGEHDFIVLVPRQAAEPQLSSSTVDRGVTLMVPQAVSRAHSSTRFWMPVNGAVAATLGMTVIGVAVTGCMAPVKYDQPRYSYFLPPKPSTPTQEVATGPAGDVAIPLKQLSLAKSTKPDAAIAAPVAMPVTAGDRSVAASAPSSAIASALNEAKPASVQSSFSAASAATTSQSMASGALALKADAHFESIKRIVNFDYASAQLNADAKQQLQTIVPLALQATSVKVKGATDASGDVNTNKRLALNRAVVVARSLIASGVAISHVKATYCTTCFVSRNDSDGGRRANRRVDIEMVMPADFKGIAASAPAAGRS